MIRLVIVEPEGAYNVGFIARLVKNFEVDEFYIVNPKCDLEEAKKFSARGIEVLEKKAKIVSSFDDAIKDADIKIATSSIADNKGDLIRKSIRPWDLEKFIGNDKRTALIFGRESVGLTREEIMKSDFLLFIPANPEYPVLNLSHAVSIVLYEIWRIKSKSSTSSISADVIKLIEKYSRDITELIMETKSEEEIEKTKILFRRVLLKGVNDNEEGMALVRLLRKIYVKLGKKE
ncbi:MAG: tRNA (cytidine-2'-O-)-methyltransferase TrmJ [Sulfolobaceae archaeon]|jgi:TrmH family RNA methyltransferase|nr:RNA methyltransferase [Stygiolobus sp.]MDT7875635.1 tRNA (cytidine-2'-O-)-methyltransferase TrmJ [Sulfolobaceae archaeon]